MLSHYFSRFSHFNIFVGQRQNDNNTMKKQQKKQQNQNQDLVEDSSNNNNNNGFYAFGALRKMIFDPPANMEQIGKLINEII